MIQLYKANRARTILFFVLALMVISSVINEEIPILFNKPADLERLKSMSWLLIPHILSSTIALVIGPFQFSSRIRSNNIRLHKKLGKLYIISIIIAAPFSILLNIYYPPPGSHMTFAFENITQGAIWLISALLAWLAAIKRQINLHKMWAARSYGMTLIFVFARVFKPIPFFGNLSLADLSHYLWFLIVMALVLPDLLIFSKELFGNRKLKTKISRPAAEPMHD